MKVLVCGGRNYKDYLRVCITLDAIQGIKTIIHGCAPGADSLADKWAKAKGINIERYPALWKKYGLGAGMIRNQQMLAKGMPNLIIAFPGGQGTANMIALAKRSKVTVVQIPEV